MNVNEQFETESQQPPARAPFQFGLKHVLAAPVWLAVFFAIAFRFGPFWGILFLLATDVLVAIWFHRVWWICALAIVLGFVLLLALLPAISPCTEAFRRAVCFNNLKQIGLALHKYHAAYGCFPPAYIEDEKGRPMHSWRVLILPYLEQKLLYDRYDFSEPWDGPNNRKLANIPLAVFNCPADDEKLSTTTSYLAVVGPNTAWPGSEPIIFADFSDGTSITILVVEVRNSGIHWMEPRDLHVVQMAPGVNPEAGQGISSGHEGGANVLFADGHASYLSEEIPQDLLQALLTIDGGETLPTDF